LNRSERLNALNGDLSRALLAALRQVHGDHTVRALVLTGAGRGFCAGGDLVQLRKARESGDRADLRAILQAGKEIVLTLATLRIPVVAAVNGRPRERE
jgi:2-(1,2-epoxy-1,2-dihydrophenyl)acetyl-CoA isomerase